MESSGREKGEGKANMDMSIIAIVYCILLFLLLGSGLWVGLALGTTGLAIAYLFTHNVGYVAGLTSFSFANSFVLTSAPMFIFMGEVLLQGELSPMLYKGISAWLSRVPGGLLHSNIVACGIFAAVCGSSPATAATIGTVAIPELEKRNYDPKLLLGSLAAGGTLGILIPPSLVMILYGAFCEESIGQLFIGGFIPGLILMTMFMIYIAIVASLRPHLFPKEEKVTWKARLLGIVGLLPMVLLILIVLGGIYAGLVTPTESAAVGATSSILIALAYRRFNFQVLKRCLFNTVRTTCMIFFVAIGAQLLAYTLGILRVPAMLAEWILSLQISPLMVLICVYILYYILGCFLDGIAMMLLTLSVVYPLVVKSLGYDGIWFGVVLVVLIEIGGITPPVGLNLYVIHGLAPHHSMGKVIVGSFPYVIIMTAMLALMTAFPEIVLWLPGQMIGTP